jgi:thioredoxin-like negative regulator of GroEL
VNFITDDLPREIPTVNSFAFAAVLQAALLATGANEPSASNSYNPAKTYAAAHKEALESGKPIVVLVGAEWCPACQTMKGSVMPSLAAQGGLKDVSFAIINTDRQSELSKQMLAGNSIPQLVMYEQTASGWKIKRLVGGQSVSAVQQFIGKPEAYVAKPEAKSDHQAAATRDSVETAGKHN